MTVGKQHAERTLVLGPSETAADAARFVLELAERLGTTPLLRRAFAGAAERARRVLAGGQP